MKILITILFTLVLSFTAYSQSTFDYGKPDELKGLTRVFIDTGAEMEDRERIIKQLNKELPDLKLLDSADEAEIVLYFRGDTAEVIGGATSNVYNNSVQTNIARMQLEQGAGTVFIKRKEAEKPRLVLSVKNSQQSKLEKRPVIKFTKAFIKAYKEANGIAK